MAVPIEGLSEIGIGAIFVFAALLERFTKKAEDKTSEKTLDVVVQSYKASIEILASRLAEQPPPTHKHKTASHHSSHGPHKTA